MAFRWLSLLVLSIFVVNLVNGEKGKRSNSCVGLDCEDNAMTLDVLKAYCEGICYRHEKRLYDKVCGCDKIVTTPPPPCTTTYLQIALCDWSTSNCSNTQYCQWRKNMSLSVLEGQNITARCDCPIKETEMKSPCKWTKEEMTLCSVLKVNQMLYSDFQCVCNTNPPTPPPSDRKACAYTKSRPAQLTPARSKRLFQGQDAYECNYPGVVGLFSKVPTEKERSSICTATLLSKDTILFDNQCLTSMREPVYALVNSYDVTKVGEKSPTVKMDTIKAVDAESITNTLFTAKLSTVLTLDDKCMQPACLPNVRIPARHIKTDDCRVLGYGHTTDVFGVGPEAKKLQEIKVKVHPTSITGNLLTVTRIDGLKNTACLHEFSAPLVCRHNYTNEWITMGIHQNTGVYCSGDKLPNTFQVANLMSEAMGNRYYENLKAYQPKAGALLPK